MRTFVRVLLWSVGSLLALGVLGAGLFFYFLWTPVPAAPQLSGALTRGAIEFAGLQRTYTLYIPQNLPHGAPLVIVMHGADGGATRIRRETGYGFERLADEHHFAVVYPNGFDGNWNTCFVQGDHAASRLNIDDVGFLTALTDKLAQEDGVDRSRVFATGVSLGGQMSLRLAIEAPSRFRAVAAVAAGVPAPGNFKCEPTSQGTSSVMIMNGVEDPLNPYNGGEVQLLGLYRHGPVRSSVASGQYLADLNHIAGAPTTKHTQFGGGVSVDDVTWHNDESVEIELMGIHGSGHGLPQPYAHGPRLLGPSPSEPNGPAVIWSFFERHSQSEATP